MAVENRGPEITEELSKKLVEFRGLWVAVNDQDVVASGASVAEVLKLARERGVTSPLVFRVSAHPERLSLL